MSDDRNDAAVLARHARAMRALRPSIAALYLAAGCLHLIAPDGFLPIMPDWIPYKRDVVILTGVCELFGAAGLAFPATQRAAGVALALYALCVFPANIKQAFDHIAVAGIPDTWWYHGPRLLLQPVLIWATLFSVGVLSWPLRAGETRSRNAERVHDPRRP